jgi:FtsP/CotA-like multicopper oxidase with cupredoxin domain
MTITGGSGMGAVPGLATIDPTTGAITAISLKAVGSGYMPGDTASVNIDPPPCWTGAATATCALATATATPYNNPTEVNMVPFNSSQNSVTPFPSWWWTSGVPFSLDDRDGGVPDPRLRGPAWVQIGTEGGFLPNPAVVPNQPINFDYNRKSITVLNVLQHSLLLGPAERADVLVDFTNFAGKTLILYSDAPAPDPASDSRLDYYTGDPDQRNTGGAPSTLPGYGPNTRTIMQIVVDQPQTAPPTGAPPLPAPTSNAPVDDYNPATLTALQTAIPQAFAASEDTIVQPQAAYQAVYPTTPMPTDVSQYVRIQDTTHVLTPIGQTAATPIKVQADLQPKAIQELFTLDYGRMNATLGTEIPNTTGVNQTTIPYGYVDPITELLKTSDASAVQITPPAVGQTYGTFADGTQIWKITHNGVDTHVIHVHMFNWQLINRVGWDGMIKPPDANELGWKDTLRMNPLEDVIVAVRPISLVNLPFKVPNSVRPMDVTMPVGATNAANTPGFSQVAPDGTPSTPAITNQLVNFGWEYVWHCHILGHEENDMMRPMAIAVPPEDPSNLAAQTSGSGNKKQIALTWTDNSLNSTGFTLQRATDSGFTQNLVTVPLGKVTSYTDPIGNTSTVYYYRVQAINVVGSTAASGFTKAVTPQYQSLTVTSKYSLPALGNPPPPPAAPTNVAATLQGVGTPPAPQVLVTFTDNATAESGFSLQRSMNGGAFAPLATLPANAGTGPVSFTDTTVTSGNTYRYQVQAFTTTPPQTSAWVLSNPVATNPPIAPALTAASIARQGGTDTITLAWTAGSYQSSYTVQWSTSSTFATITGAKTGIAASALGTTITGLSRGTPGVTTYYVRVQGVNVLGASAWSTWPSGLKTQ